MATGFSLSDIIHDLQFRVPFSVYQLYCFGDCERLEVLQAHVYPFFVVCVGSDLDLVQRFNTGLGVYFILRHYYGNRPKALYNRTHERPNGRTG